MIQVQFTDEGKLHTVTFSGEEADLWAYRFRNDLWQKYEIKCTWKNISAISEV